MIPICITVGERLRAPDRKLLVVEQTELARIRVRAVDGSEDVWVSRLLLFRYERIGARKCPPCAECKNSPTDHHPLAPTFDDVREAFYVECLHCRKTALFDDGEGDGDPRTVGDWS